MTHADGPPDDRSALDMLIRGYQVSRMIRVAADLGIADELPVDGVRDVADLATACQVLPGPLLRLLRALAAFGIFRVSAAGEVAHSPLSLLLRRDAPGSFHHAARFWTAPGAWKAWGELDVALTGGIPHQAAWGMDRFQYLRAHPEEGRLFDEFMSHFPHDPHGAIAAAFDFSGARLIVDVGGGNGELLRRILARFPGPRGIVLDREDVVGRIRPGALMDGRLTPVPGSFFDHIPAGGDVYMLVRVLHDWSDRECMRILEAVRAATGPDARLLIVEHILDPEPGRGSPALYLLDIQMMAMFGEARERTGAEFGDLLTRSGFRPGRQFPTAAAVRIIEARPA
jgi:hypothetical protein